MNYFAGIDVGSTTTKAIIIDDKGSVISDAIIPTGYNSKRAIDICIGNALEKSRLKNSDISFLVSTGYGRARVEKADLHVTEISAHAKGVYHLFNGTRTIIDVGGQDSKAMRINLEGRVVDFAMNDKCAAGTGRFLENMARVLELDLDEMANLSNSFIDKSESIKISSTCTVFAETEIVSLIHQGIKREAIVSALFDAIVSRVLAIVSRIGIEREVTITGGVAKNSGFINSIKRNLGYEVNIPAEPQITGALGSALIARDRFYERSEL